MNSKPPLPYTSPTVPYLRLRIELRARSRATLPPYKGSLLRGALGHALRRAVCAMGPDTQCRSCPVGLACIYTHIFETFIDGGPRPFAGGLPAAPHPYVVEPHGTTRSFKTGDPLTFDLLLFGRAAGLQSFLVMALDRMARHGLGARRHPFSLEEVRYQDPSGRFQPGYRRGRRRWPGQVKTTLPATAGFDTQKIQLRFSTPTRIKVRKRLIQDFDFKTLAFKMLRRTLEIAHFHVPGQVVDWNFREWLARADAVEITSSSLRWRDWQRYSNRQKRKMNLGGFVGEVALEGDLEPFAPLLRTAEVIHVGKGTTFGLGKVELKPA